MTRCPKIGTRVQVEPGLTHSGFIGTATKLYPQYRYDDIGDRPTDELLPESEWHVCVKVDRVPDRWPYPGTDLIAPPVSELRRAPRASKVPQQDQR